MTDEEKRSFVRREGERWAFQALLLREQGKHRQACGFEARAARAVRYVLKEK